MKIKLITAVIVSMLYFLASDAIAQTRVEINSVAVMKYNNYTNGLLLGDPVAKANTIFGNPSSTSTQYNEMEEKQMTLYKYGTGNILYFMDGVLVAYELTVGGTFTVGKINGPALTTNSTSIAAIGWNLALTSEEKINATTPVPGGGTPYVIQYYKSGDIFKNDVNTDTYFQVCFIPNGNVKTVSVAFK